ncbi:MAG: hypothetical protein LBS74_01845 [Oscillospiraceae bacterium]|jgi:hypothetical protein|nr:hypothetical protein [Oscillospiraceae bacterium]
MKRLISLLSVAALLLASAVCIGAGAAGTSVDSFETLKAVLLGGEKNITLSANVGSIEGLTLTGGNYVIDLNGKNLILPSFTLGAKTELTVLDASGNAGVFKSPVVTIPEGSKFILDSGIAQLDEVINVGAFIINGGSVSTAAGGQPNFRIAPTNTKGEALVPYPITGSVPNETYTANIKSSLGDYTYNASFDSASKSYLYVPVGSFIPAVAKIENLNSSSIVANEGKNSSVTVSVSGNPVPRVSVTGVEGITYDADRGKILISSALSANEYTITVKAWNGFTLASKTLKVVIQGAPSGVDDTTTSTTSGNPATPTDATTTGTGTTTAGSTTINPSATTTANTSYVYTYTNPTTKVATTYGGTTTGKGPATGDSAAPYIFVIMLLLISSACVWFLLKEQKTPEDGSAQ